MVMIHAASQRIPVGPSASPFLPLTRRSAYHDPFCLSRPFLPLTPPLVQCPSSTLCLNSSSSLFWAAAPWRTMTYGITT